MPARTSDQSLVDAATGVIRDRILDLSLPPAKAINTKDLAQQLKLSRTPVREALNRLAAEGLIRIEANHGVFVHPLDVDEINQLMEANRVAERLSAFYCDFDDPGLIAETYLALRSGITVFGGSPWNSYFKVARGWQDPAMFGYRVDTSSGSAIVSQGPKPKLPVRLYLGLGTDF